MHPAFFGAFSRSSFGYNPRRFSKTLAIETSPMPIYEYQCSACAHRLEAIQKVADTPLTVCPQCGEAGLQRLLSAPTFRLKGAGWYETDFKASGRRHLADTESAGGTQAAASSEGQSTPTAADKASDGVGQKAAAPAKSGTESAAD